MPNRILRAGINGSEKVDRLTEPEENFYRRLMSVVDDFGLCEADVTLLRADCYPRRTDRIGLDEIERRLQACAKAGLVRIYRNKGKRYLEFLELGPPRAKSSKCPMPNDKGSHECRCAHMNADECRCSHTQTYVPYSNSDSGSYSSAGSSACAGSSTHTPPAANHQPLTAEEWALPDPAQLANEVGRAIALNHWTPSEVPLTVSAIAQVLATSTNPGRDAESILSAHGRWKAAFLAGLLDKEMRRKRAQYWVADEIWLQEPPVLEAVGEKEFRW